MKLFTNLHDFFRWNEDKKYRGLFSDDYTSQIDVYLGYSLPEVVIKYNIFDKLIITISLKDEKNVLGAKAIQASKRINMSDTNSLLIDMAYWKQYLLLSHKHFHWYIPGIAFARHVIKVERMKEREDEIRQNVYANQSFHCQNFRGNYI